MNPRFVEIDRDTPMLLPPDLRDWIGEDDIVHFIIEAVNRLPLEIFKVNVRGSGSRQFPPHMMLSLLIYCYAHGIFSSRKIQQATYRDVAVRYLAANTHPDHDTICKFRRENLAAFQAAFVDILELAIELKLLKFGNVALDGTHIKANASIDKNINYERATQIREQLRIDIGELIHQAEQSDQQEESSKKLPDEIARLEKLASKMDQAIDNLKQRAADRQEKEREKYERKLAERKKKEKEEGRKLAGYPPKEPDVKAEDLKEQSNLTDPDARIMRKNHRSGYTSSYNAQACVDTEGSQLIVGQYVSQSASDNTELINGVESIPLGNPESVSTDACLLYTSPSPRD